MHFPREKSKKEKFSLFFLSTWQKNHHGRIVLYTRGILRKRSKSNNRTGDRSRKRKEAKLINAFFSHFLSLVAEQKKGGGKNFDVGLAMREKAGRFRSLFPLSPSRMAFRRVFKGPGKCPTSLTIGIAIRGKRAGRRVLCF